MSAASSPFVGLSAFTPHTAMFFTGRERFALTLAGAVLRSRVTVLFGQSGAGKTSVLGAALPQALRATLQRPASRRDFDPAPATGEPLRILQFRRWYPGFERRLLRAAAAKLHMRDAPSLRAAVVGWTKMHGSPVILVLDQFEEFLLYHPNAADTEFVQQVAAVAADPNLDVRVLIALREDALASLDSLRAVVPGVLASPIPLRPLDERAAEQAIRKPVCVYNERHRAGQPRIVVEDALVSTLIRELKEMGTGLDKGRAVNTGEKQIELPFLQLVLTKLWAAEGGRNAEALREETLIGRLGGVKRIVRDHVRKIMDELDQDEKELCVRIFGRLVTGLGSKIAYPTKALVADVAGLGVTQAKVEQVLGKLARREARIVMPVVINGWPGYELLHDVLGSPLLEWQRKQHASVPVLNELEPDDRVSKTFSLEIPDTQTYPEYKIPPEEDKRLKIRFGCAPLLDCCFPLLVQNVDLQTWNGLARSRAIDVDIHIVDFSNLFNEVDSPASDSGVDMVIASAASVDTARSSHVNRDGVSDRAPVAVLPILQQFNAYYVFAKRTELTAYLERKGLNWAAELCVEMRATSTLNAMLGKTTGKQNDDAKGILRNILRNFTSHIERGADLEAALTSYWACLGEERSRPQLRFAETSSIITSFASFISAEEPSLFMGGLAQTAFLTGRSDVGGEYIIIAGPNDINYPNVNSLVCSKELAHGRPTDILRFISWWFDVLNCFRRSILFKETRDPNLYNSAIEAIQKGLHTSYGSTVKIVPPGAEPKDIECMLDFIRIKSAKEIGSFMLPNIYDALKVETTLTDNLSNLDAVVNFIQSKSVTAVEKRFRPSGGAASDGA